MDNSMIEYKKKNKLADMIDSLKFNAKILFAGKNQDKIKLAIMDRDEDKRLESLEKCDSKLEWKNIFSIIENLSEEDRIEALNKYENELSDDEIGDIINSLVQQDKLVLLNKYVDRIKSNKVSLIICNMDSSQKLEAIRISVEKMNDKDIEEVLLSNLDDKLEILKLTKDKISKEFLLNFINDLDTEDKKEAIGICIKNINEEMVKNIIFRVEKNERIEFMKLLDTKVSSREKGEIIKEIINGYEDGSEKVDLLIKYSNDLANVDITDMLGSLDDENKEKLLEFYITYNFSQEKIEVIKSFNDEKRKEILKEKKEQMNYVDIEESLMAFQDADKKEMLDFYKNEKTIFQHNSWEELLKKIIPTFESEERKEVLEKYINDISEDGFYYILRSWANEERTELLVKYKNFVINEPIQFLYEILPRLPDKDKKEIIKEYDADFDLETKKIMISCISDEEIVKELLDEYELYLGDDINLVSKYVAKLDLSVLEHGYLLNSESIELLGEEEHFQLVKYIVIPGSMGNIDISQALKNPENFKKYMTLRESFSKQGLPVQNIASSIQEYSVYNEIIDDILGCEEIDEKQIKILDELVKDEPYDEIKTADDLEKYSALRKERFEKKIIEDSKESTYLLLLGITHKEYQEIVRTFGENKTLAEELKGMLEDFPEEERGQISEIIAMLKVVDLINDMPEEQRQVTLTNFNKELEKEFEEDSRISDIRKNMRDVRKKVREIFGKELSESLNIEITEKTEIEKVEDEGEKEIEVINLKGEEFKLLVHVLNADIIGTPVEKNHYDIRGVGKPQRCMSLISDKYMGVASGKPIVAFTSFAKEAFIVEGHNNLATNPSVQKNDLNVLPLNNACFRKSDEIIENSVREDNEFNEVDVYNEYMDKNGEIQTLVPSHIVCFDEIDELSKQEARLIAEKFGLDKPLPILVIHTEKYKDRIEEYAKEVRGESQEQEVIEEQIEGKTISDRVEEIMKIAEERAETRVVAKVKMEMINLEEQEMIQESQGYKKPTAMMSKDNGFVH